MLRHVADILLEIEISGIMERNKTDILVVSTNQNSLLKMHTIPASEKQQFPAIPHPLTLATTHFLNTMGKLLEPETRWLNTIQSSRLRSVFGFLSGQGFAFRDVPVKLNNDETFNIWRFDSFGWEQVDLLGKLKEKVVLVVCTWSIEITRYVKLVEIAQKINAGTLLFDRQMTQFASSEMNGWQH